jgi:hypothetical protein
LYEFTTVVSSVTSPMFAISGPVVAPLCVAMDWYAMTVPCMAAVMKMSAREPQLHHTLVPWVLS